MLEINIKYNSRNSVLLPFGVFPLISGRGRYFRGDRYFRDLIGGKKLTLLSGSRYFREGGLLSEFYGMLYSKRGYS